MNNQNFGAALRTDRTSMGFTQEEFCSSLSEFTGMTIQQQSLARWEMGAIPRNDTLTKLFEFLKHVFALRQTESEVLKLGYPKPSVNKKNTVDLLKIIDEQTSEIIKLKDVIRTLLK